MRMKKTVAASGIGVLKLSFVALRFTVDEKIKRDIDVLEHATTSGKGQM